MIKAITGTKDILPSEIKKWRDLEDTVHQIMNNFNYSEIRTPVFEETRLFKRGIGESTDIVSKEMYSFLDRSDTSITLKPEMTACVVRALIEHSLDKQQQLNKLYYLAPMFRQERPQAGRFRQFHQFGAEVLGSTSPNLDAEIIIIAYRILQSLGLKDLTLQINSLGIPTSRASYKRLLKEYLSDKLNSLSKESQQRLETNILRLFDSKSEDDQLIMADAPLLLDHLDEESLEHFEKVKELLDAVKIPYEINPKLVRGLDYYTHTTFEITSNSVGAQAALCGGGRYDLLVQEVGDRDVPGVGFAAGIERILLACDNEGIQVNDSTKIDFYIVRLEKELDNEVFKMASNLRDQQNSVEVDYNLRSVKAQMREANKLGAQKVIMIGGDEYQRGMAVLKNMETSEQTEIEISKLLN